MKAWSTKAASKLFHFFPMEKQSLHYQNHKKKPIWYPFGADCLLVDALDGLIRYFWNLSAIFTLFQEKHKTSTFRVLDSRKQILQKFAPPNQMFSWKIGYTASNHTIHPFLNSAFLSNKFCKVPAWFILLKGTETKKDREISWW